MKPGKTAEFEEKMKLFTKPIEAALRKAGVDGNKPICKLFTPDAQCTWVLTGLENDGDTLWGFADLGMGCVEFGTISLNEIKNLKGRLGLPIERDLHFNPNEFTFQDLAGKTTLAGI